MCKWSREWVALGLGIEEIVRRHDSLVRRPSQLFDSQSVIGSELRPSILSLIQFHLFRWSLSLVIARNESRLMEIVVQILKHLPPGWPRIIVLVGLGMLFFFPELRRALTKRHQDKEQLEQVKQLLELRKLELTVVDLRAKHPEAKNETLTRKSKKYLANRSQ